MGECAQAKCDVLAFWCNGSATYEWSEHNVLCAQGVRHDYRSSPNTECCMSGQSSKVKWPIPAPDGTFPLLDEGGVKKQVQT